MRDGMGVQRGRRGKIARRDSRVVKGARGGEELPTVTYLPIFSRDYTSCALQSHQDSTAQANPISPSYSR